MLHYRYKSDKELSFKNLKKVSNLKREISVIMPTYNEEDNIKNLVNSVKKELKDYNFEIIIVDDNSKDKTGEIIDKLAGKRVIALHRYHKKGIFSALQDGVKIANGNFLIFMDSDFSHPPEMIKEFLKYKDNYDIVSGSRFVKGGGMEAGFIRRNGSLWINKICGFIMGLDIKDVAGGFTLIKSDKFWGLDFKYEAKFGEFAFELFYRAKKKKFKIIEIPFIYRFRRQGGSKMNVIENTYYYIKRAFQLRFDK